MGKGWIIFRQELYTAFMRPSFWISVLFLPVLSLALYGGLNKIAASQSAENNQMMVIVEDLLVPKEDPRPQAYVDQAGIMRQMPPEFPKDRLLAYSDEPSARRALAAGKLSGYFVIPTDYLKTGVIFFDYEEINLYASRSMTTFRSLLNYNLLEGNHEALAWVEAPVVDIRENNLSQYDGQRLLDAKGGINRAALTLPVMLQMFIVMEIFAVSGLLLTAFNREHENRTLEILLTSSDTYSLLLAKTGALGLAGITQLAAWDTSGMFLAQMSGQEFSVRELLTLSPAVLLWTLALCLAAYLFFGALMISIGALVSGLREFSQLATMVMLPIFLPLILIFMILQDPNGWAAMLMSFIPFTSPSALIARMVMIPVPHWQPALALVLLVASGLACLRITAKLIHAQRLMGGSNFYLSDWFKRTLISKVVDQ